MDTNNVNNAHFWQIDHHVKQAAQINQVVVLPSPKAWEQFSWTRQYFKTKPSEGYFVWVKEPPNCPLFSCVSIASKKIKQQLQNLLVVEAGLKIKLQGVCYTIKSGLKGNHQAQGKIILKPGVNLEYNHIHSWRLGDTVQTDYQFLLEAGAKLTYTYKNNQTPGKLQIKNLMEVSQRAKAVVNILVDCQQSKFTLEDEIRLKGKAASGISNLRLVGRKESQIEAHSRMVGEAAGTGHLECDGLLVAKTAKISLIPELICQDKQAQLTHEASIGKVSEEQLNYLRMRGLSEKEALNLIVTGFLKLPIAKK